MKEKQIIIEENVLKEIKEIAKENIGTCSFSWQCEECCFGCLAYEIMKICEKSYKKINEVLNA